MQLAGSVNVSSVQLTQSAPKKTMMKNTHGDSSTDSESTEEDGPPPFSVDNNDKFIKFLRRTLNIRDKEWATVRTLGQALERYEAAQRATAMLEEWGWARSSGGFQVPAGDVRDIKDSRHFDFNVICDSAFFSYIPVQSGEMHISPEIQLAWLYLSNIQRRVMTVLSLNMSGLKQQCLSLLNGWRILRVTRGIFHKCLWDNFVSGVTKNFVNMRGNSGM
jgi:hypothetical protein